MPIMRKVINFNNPSHPKILCCWDECDRDGFELHKVRVNYGSPGSPYCTTYIFCSERHRQYWLHAPDAAKTGRKVGDLPPGYRLSIT